LLLIEAHLEYDEKNDKMNILFGFGMAGIDTDLRNIIVLKSPVTDEFVGKMPNIQVVFKSNEGDSEEEESD
jgi:hypothetical protein